MPNKFNAEKVVIDDYIFDSKVEARFYVYLKRLREKGEIKKIMVHPKYVLQNSFTKYGEKHREILYVADFEVVWADARRIVYDVKGKETSEARIKRKLFINKFNMPLKWVAFSKKYGNENGFIDWFLLQKKRKEAKKENLL